MPKVTSMQLDPRDRPRPPLVFFKEKERRKADGVPPSKFFNCQRKYNMKNQSTSIKKSNSFYFGGYE